MENGIIDMKSVKVIITDLDVDVKEEELRAAFGEFGRILTCKVCWD